MKLQNGQVKTFGGTIYFAVDGTLFTGLIIYMGISSQRCIFTGVYYLKVYIIYRGILFTGVYYLQGYIIYRGILFTGAHCIQGYIIYRAI